MHLSRVPGTQPCRNSRMADEHKLRGRQDAVESKAGALALRMRWKTTPPMVDLFEECSYLRLQYQSSIKGSRNRAALRHRHSNMNRNMTTFRL